MTLHFIVHTTSGLLHLMARSAADAITTALELAGTGAKVLRVSRGGDW